MREKKKFENSHRAGIGMFGRSPQPRWKFSTASPLVIPLKDGVYACEIEAAGAPTLMPPNVEIEDGEVVAAYNSVDDSMRATDLRKEYDFFWSSTLSVDLNGIPYRCIL